MTASFNSKKDKARLFRVEHSERSSKFTPACDQSRRMRRVSDLTLADLAAFVTVYEVAEAMIDEVEALLIRTFANDLLNIKMENFMAKRLNSGAVTKVDG